MNPSELLNADIGTIGRMAAEGVRWWVAELRDMLPRALADALVAKPSLVLAREDGGEWVLRRRGKPVAAPFTGWRVRDALVLLPADRLLVRDVPLPRLGREDTRRLVASDLDRLTPFKADTVTFDVERTDGEDGPRQTARLAVIPRALAAEAWAAAEAWGCTPARMAVELHGRTRFDFAPAMIETGAVRRPRSLTPLLWSLVACLILANVGMLIYRDHAVNQRLEDRIAEEEARAAQVNRQRALVVRENKRRQSLAELRRNSDPVRLLNAISDKLPAGAWVQQLTLNDEGIEMKGFRRADVDVLAALRSTPGLTGWRNSDAEFAEQNEGPLPFAVQADRVKP